MSYSFQVRAQSIGAALIEAARKFDDVVNQQACHARDKAQALAAAKAFAELLTVDESKDVSITMSGYLSGNWQGSDVTRISSASVNVSVGHVEPLPQAA